MRTTYRSLNHKYSRSLILLNGLHVHANSYSASPCCICSAVCCMNMARIHATRYEDPSWPQWHLYMSPESRVPTPMVIVLKKCTQVYNLQNHKKQPIKVIQKFILYNIVKYSSDNYSTLNLRVAELQMQCTKLSGPVYRADNT